MEYSAVACIKTKAEICWAIKNKFMFARKIVCRNPHEQNHLSTPLSRAAHVNYWNNMPRKWFKEKLKTSEKLFSDSLRANLPTPSQGLRKRDSRSSFSRKKLGQLSIFDLFEFPIDSFSESA